MVFTASRSAVLLACSVAAGSASALTGSEGFFYNNVEVAQLDWTTVGSTTFFSLDLLSAPNGSAFGKALDFNGPAGTFMDTDTTTLSTGTFGAHNVGPYPFTWNVAFSTSGADKLTLGETATWTIDNAGPFNPDMPVLSFGSFHGSGQGIKLCGVSLVPEPGTVPLMLAGLAGVGLLARRRRLG